MTPQEQVARLLAAPLPGPPVVPGSTPVIFFGDLSTARVATLGINPSRKEFLDRDGHLMTGPRRRLATRPGLGVADAEPLQPHHCEQVLADCRTYFQRNPYRTWFDPLDEILRRGLGASYYDGTACHLDLTPWATDPIWSGITEATVRHALLDSGMPALAELVGGSSLQVLVVNGSAVWKEMTRAGLVDPKAEATLCFGVRQARTTVYSARLLDVSALGWTLNVQSSHGVRTADRAVLADWLRVAAAAH